MVDLFQRLMDVTQLQRDTASVFLGRPVPQFSSATRRQRAAHRLPAPRLAHRSLDRCHRLEVQAIAVAGHRRSRLGVRGAADRRCRARTARWHERTLGCTSNAACLGPLLTALRCCIPQCYALDALDSCSRPCVHLSACSAPGTMTSTVGLVGLAVMGQVRLRSRLSSLVATPPPPADLGLRDGIMHPHLS